MVHPGGDEYGGGGCIGLNIGRGCIQGVEYGASTRGCIKG